jgi:hypothetical protein
VKRRAQEQEGQESLWHTNRILVKNNDFCKMPSHGKKRNRKCF